MRSAILLAMVFLSGTVSWAAERRSLETDSEFSESSSEPKPLARKEPSIFHRPARRTPADQLVYAQSLEATGRRRRARRQYRALVHAWHNAPEALHAQAAYARLLEEARRYEKAFEEYQYLLDRFPGRVSFDEIVDRQAAIANLMETRRVGGLGIFRGFRSPERALSLWEQVLRNAPCGPWAEAARFHLATIHEESGDFEEAAAIYEEILYRDPRGARAEEAAAGRARCLARVAEKRRWDEGAIRDALSALTLYLREYRDSPTAPEMERRLTEFRERLADLYFERASFYERVARKPGAALIAYRDFLRQFPLSRHAVAVAQRVAELEDRLDVHPE